VVVAPVVVPVVAPVVALVWLALVWLALVWLALVWLASHKMAVLIAFRRCCAMECVLGLYPMCLLRRVKNPGLLSTPWVWPCSCRKAAW
jgi:hypothetical protein